MCHGHAQIQEQKGLDIVRRDWCGLSKDAGHSVLAAVLSCRPCEEVVADIHDHLRYVYTHAHTHTRAHTHTHVLSCRPCEEVAADIHSHLRYVVGPVCEHRSLESVCRSGVEGPCRSVEGPALGSSRFLQQGAQGVCVCVCVTQGCT